jgi:hypothetical protein
MSLYSKLSGWLSTPWTSAELADKVFIQIGHILGGYGIALTTLYFGHALWIAAVLVQVWAVPKEFWFDYKYENAAQRGSSPLDFSMYQVGLALAIIISFLRH